MYKKNKAFMKHCFNILALLGAVSISGMTLVQGHELQSASNNLSQQSKITLEKRLSTFLQTVDGYEPSLQNELYIKLQSKIDMYESRYDTDSDIYSMLQIIATIADHKLDSNSVLTNNQILSHAIYGMSFLHYAQSPVESDEEIEIDKEIETQQNYRADLDTEELNELDKNIVAGSAKGILQLEVRSNYEGVKSESVEFRFNENIDNIGLVGRLYHDGIFVGESSQSDAKGNVLIIDNLPDFVIGTQTSYVQLEIVTQSIGKEQIGKALSNLRVVSTTFKDNTGAITGDKIGDRVDTENSKSFSIVPADIKVSVESAFERYVSTAQIHITPNVGNNNDQGNIFSTALSSITLEVSSFIAPGNVIIFNSNGTQIGSGNISSSGDTIISFSPDTISNNGETYSISTTARGVFRISQNGITYAAGNKNFESRFTQQLFLGQR